MEDDTIGAAEAYRRQASFRSRERRRSSLRPRKTLQSEVTKDDAVGLLTFVQSISTSFRGFSEDETVALAEYFSVMRFEAGQTIVEQGETGTWFGILLAGTLQCEIGSLTFTTQAGAIVGEMAMWQSDSVRSATLKGGEPGLIATMLVAELPGFVATCPDAGAKLMQVTQVALFAAHDDASTRRCRWAAGSRQWQRA